MAVSESIPEEAEKIQADVRDIAGSGPDHRNKVNTSMKGVT